MASLDPSVLCTVDPRRRVMSHLVFLVVLLAASASPAMPVVAGVVPADTKSAPAPVVAKININTADVKELMKLPGVGRGLAEKIVQYRDAHGLFKKATDLRKVEGVGNELWERNRQRIVVK
jgi:competence protein ComEA